MKSLWVGVLTVVGTGCVHGQVEAEVRSIEEWTRAVEVGGVSALAEQLTAAPDSWPILSFEDAQAEAGKSLIAATLRAARQHTGVTQDVAAAEPLIQIGTVFAERGGYSNSLLSDVAFRLAIAQVGESIIRPGDPGAYDAAAAIQFPNPLYSFDVLVDLLQEAGTLASVDLDVGSRKAQYRTLWTQAGLDLVGVLFLAGWEGVGTSALLDESSVPVLVGRLMLTECGQHFQLAGLVS